MKSSFKRFFKLINFEINRASKLIFILMAVMIATNIAEFIFRAFSYRNDVNERAIAQSISPEAVIQEIGPLNFQYIINTGFITLPILLAFCALFIYTFFTWYREWFGKHTFVFRLLTLPMSRMQVYFSKLAALCLGILVLMSTQHVLFYIGQHLVNWILPSDWFSYSSLDVMIGFDFLFSIVLPIQFTQFVYIYGIGLLLIVMLFTVILMERSYKIPGIFAGGLYGVLGIAYLISPALIPNLAKNYYILFDWELITLHLFTYFSLFIASLFYSHYLLTRKITV